LIIAVRNALLTRTAALVGVWIFSRCAADIACDRPEDFGLSLHVLRLFPIPDRSTQVRPSFSVVRIVNFVVCLSPMDLARFVRLCTVLHGFRI
jgi:hypothetical protein